ncbi:MAG: hypothetical protein HPY68_02670 [Candidatus Atribacteria bacterium]|nr:hypothetical protein [Candidatus Atribacteria bacterium]
MKKIPVFLVLLSLIFLVAGCSGVVIVGPEPPIMGDVKICTYSSYIYGYVYIDGRDTGSQIDGWGGPYCTGYIRVELDRTHTIEVWSALDGITYSGSFRPTYSGQTITIP